MSMMKKCCSAHQMGAIISPLKTVGVQNPVFSMDLFIAKSILSSGEELIDSKDFFLNLLLNATLLSHPDKFLPDFYHCKRIKFAIL